MTPDNFDPLAIPPAVPCEVTDEQLAEKYSRPNPFDGPDPNGGADITLKFGGISTAATRARRRALLAEAWDEGRANWEQRRRAASA